MKYKGCKMVKHTLPSPPPRATSGTGTVFHMFVFVKICGCFMMLLKMVVLNKICFSIYRSFSCQHSTGCAVDKYSENAAAVNTCTYVSQW